MRKRENIYIFSIEYIYYIHSISIVGRIFSSSKKIAAIDIHLSIIFKGIMIFTGYLVH